MTTILVTGATGQVGRRFVPRLLQWVAPDETVRVLVRGEESARHFTELGAEAVLGDLRDADARKRALEGADAVVNVAAAFRGVPDEEAWAVNRDAAIALGREAAAAGVRRFVQASTNLVYGAGRGRPAAASDPLQPETSWGVYPRSKAEAEAGLAEVPGLAPVVVRLAFVYGEGDPHLTQSARFIVGWPAHRRLPMVHHADVAQALFRALRTPGIEGRIYNAVDDAPVTAWDLHRLNGIPFPAENADAVDPDPWNGMADNLPLRDELGWRPLHPSVWSARDAGAL
ncbi:NAD-dependent epimerase/dehydratase family protein [Streptacidiphilus jiangxiensis]|uniref:Nucleoside-diphosphate-sugar epimerase n=1 Tax=Streptacidiphilus jiangxiensis TaxID=235985 RepID=A0A1H7YDW0_STRJI|nr:NAD(P)-dependent oxidoreductase [Streptacidiphilus jiangxiensis]SEM44412.1 Nucleoside-diphosphate-sugar epimerase [Streptacidiphilus jiangxiensis]